MEMKLWGGDNNNPTWSLTVDPLNLPTFDLSHDLTHDGTPDRAFVLRIANECWNWVSQQRHARGAGDNNYVVVS